MLIKSLIMNILFSEVDGEAIAGQKAKGKFAKGHEVNSNLVLT
jgi:hypothetical protein